MTAAFTSLIISSAFIVWALRAIKVKWVSFAIILIWSRCLLDAGLAPLITDIFQLQPRGASVLQASPAEMPEAVMYLTIHYMMIAIGLFLATTWMTCKERKTREYSGHKLAVAWNGRVMMAALISVAIGLISWLIVFAFLLKSNSLLSLASQRALFTDEQALSHPLFSYAQILVPFMRIGSWGLLLFSRRLNLGIWIVGLDVFLEILLGGRSRALMAIMSAFFIIILRDPKISIRGVKKLAQPFLLVILSAYVAITLITILRFGSLNVFDTNFAYLFYQRRLDEVVFAFNFFPGSAPFLNGQSLVAGISQIIPGLELPGAANAWRYITEILNPNYVYKGIGGFNYATTAENYMNFGVVGIWVLALFYGLFFGTLIAWCSRNKSNRFFVMLYVSTLIVLISAIDAKATYAIAGFFTNSLLPISVIALLARQKKREQTHYIILFCFGAGFLILSKLLDTSSILSGFKYVAIMAIGVMYLVGVRALNRVRDLQSKYKPWSIASSYQPKRL